MPRYKVRIRAAVYYNYEDIDAESTDEAEDEAIQVLNCEDWDAIDQSSDCVEIDEIDAVLLDDPDELGEEYAQALFDAYEGYPQKDSGVCSHCGCDSSW
jgi:hypothetical protein